MVGEFDDRPLYEDEKEDEKRKKRFRGQSILDEEVTEHGETRF